MTGFVVISGCSGGGKSTLLAALKAEGFAVVEEPGRRIVAEERATEGQALPWVDLEAFARRAIDMAIADHEAAGVHSGWTFFDRGLVDAAVALEMATGEAAVRDLNAAYPYHPTVFLAPPWPEIHTVDAERRHGIDAAIEEFERLSVIYPALGYRVILLPKVSVEARVRFVLDALGRGRQAVS